MPFKLQGPLPAIGLELYQLGYTLGQKKNTLTMGVNLKKKPISRKIN